MQHQRNTSRDVIMERILQADTRYGLHRELYQNQDRRLRLWPPEGVANIERR